MKTRVSLNPYFLKDTYANKNFSIIEGINYETQT